MIRVDTQIVVDKGVDTRPLKHYALLCTKLSSRLTVVRSCKGFITSRLTKKSACLQKECAQVSTALLPVMDLACHESMADSLQMERSRRLCEVQESNGTLYFEQRD
ncbi:uncharacterized protein LOC134189631 [Corticium candelabrum]|uniref:uncharacterized protein LOC134189631 n=1 Tax=Corticium candelabrum TaxID=121492 RepID=UPI002E2762F0|nr:uncharacterized protein LOC134189631 [Corticium candelabrum]